MLIEKMQERNGNLPTTTASTAAIDALKALGVKRVSLATPCPKDHADFQEHFIEGNGLEVLHKTWIRKKTKPYSDLSPDEVYSLAEQANVAESQAIFISCVSMHAIELIKALEKEFKKPVITSN